jgi:Uma2 family endonuclease
MSAPDSHARQAPVKLTKMIPLPKTRMTVDEYLAWAEGRPGRYELYAGVVYDMAPERIGHAEVKFAVQVALLAGIRRAGLPCYVLPDGITVRVDLDTAHEPNALVYCGERLPSSAIEAPNPIIVVEVLSPSTRRIDASAKLAGYFKVASVRHYLIIDPERRLVIHHARGEQDVIATRIVSSGVLKLEPPGIEIGFEEMFEA